MLLERCPTVLWRHAAGRVVLLDAGDPTAEPLTMSGLGALVWLAVDRPSSAADLRALLTEVLEQDGGPDPSELQLAVSGLVDRGLLRTVTPLGG